MGLKDFFLDLNALVLEYENPEGAIPDRLKTKFQISFVMSCFCILCTASTINP